MIHAEFKEDGFDGSELTLHVSISTEHDRVTLFTEGDYELPPVYFTPDRARAIAAALMDAANITDGAGAPNSLFGTDQS
ncbi:hypothetical protein [Deinococcus sp. QL22]|uniref:hypothetical protein n=1 Tax=Deinococcus sp. QL22 TaxID=2939437 RepID=UPI002017A6A1|nr:hypothetical protein [Deinococcus sp. QL22]UQN10325.1 hypothetical protein M1R55_29680 [Deinococcus sp. QL22]UQN10459.1 hypothetical protein M1R55_29005 [Deinococcus sp. QL22]